LIDLEVAIMQYKYIELEVDEGVALIRFNRPEALNALCPPMEDEIHAALDDLDRDSSVRAIIMTGNGRAFCAGYDQAGANRSRYGAGEFGPKGVGVGEHIGDWYTRDSAGIERLLHLWRLSKPVIAAVNGWAMGGGFWYQLAADITIASTEAVFAQPEVRHTSNTTFLFAALAGWKAANRYSLTGDHFDAAEALRLGLVNEVVEPELLIEKSVGLARRIAQVPEPAVRLNKAICMQGLLSAGVHSGLLLNGALSAMAHSSYNPVKARLDEIRSEHGVKAYLAARDTPFLPEPFGPKSR
jgi:enoyl-CoA hydratase/carnithine racemase